MPVSLLELLALAWEPSDRIKAMFGLLTTLEGVRG